MDDLRPRLGGLGLDGALERVLATATPRAAVEVNSLLASPRFADSPALTAAAIGELTRAGAVDQAAVLRVAAELSAPGVGDGLVRLETARTDTAPSKTALRELASGEADWRGADRAAASASAEELAPLARKLLRPQPLRPPVTDTPPAADVAPVARTLSAAVPAASASPAAAAAATSPSGRRRRGAAATQATAPAAPSPAAPAPAKPAPRRRKPTSGGT